MAPEERWTNLLTRGHPPLRMTQRMMRHIPSPPRCKLCFNPFGGPMGRVLRLAGFKPSRKNPRFCSRCCDVLPPGGAEIDIGVVFVDVRGSAGLADTRSASGFAELLNRFYATATDTLVEHDAVVDKLIGDEVMALFVPGFAGSGYRRRAVEAAAAMLKAFGYGPGSEPWINVGVGVNAGVAYVGNVGDAVVDFTALGDTVNVASRLQGRAESGQVVMAEDLREVSADLFPDAEHRTVSVEGRDAEVGVFVARL